MGTIGSVSHHMSDGHALWAGDTWVRSSMGRIWGFSPGRRETLIQHTDEKVN